MLRKVANLILVLFVTLTGTVSANVRVEDLTRLKGVRSNQLIGIGLVVGLNGTGDKGNSPAVTKMLESMYSNMEMNIDRSKLQTKNVAVVTVTATLKAFAEEGSDMDVTLSSTGTCSSLQGGELIITPLKGADGKVYALAQGNVVVPSGAASTVALVPDGATLEEEIQTDFTQNGKIRLLLKDANFTTARQIVSIINQDARTEIAKAINGGVVEVTIPKEIKDNVKFVSKVMDLPVVNPNKPATVVVNQRTGTVVINENVWVSPVAISQDGLKVTVNSNPAFNTILQYNANATPVNAGAQAKAPRPMGTSLDRIVTALQNMQISTKELIAILQALKKAGALHANLIIM